MRNPNVGQASGGLTKQLFFFLLLCRGYIVTFTKVLVIYHSWIHPSIILLHPCSPHSWNSLNRYHFSFYIHVHTVFALYSPSSTLSLYPAPPHTGTNHPPCSLNYKNQNDIFVCSKELYREFPCDISMYICIITQTGSFPLSPFYFTPLLMVISTGLNVLYSFLYRKYINYVHLLNVLLWCHLKSGFFPPWFSKFHLLHLLASSSG
jgi:hypothetical protein